MIKKQLLPLLFSFSLLFGNAGGTVQPSNSIPKVKEITFSKENGKLILHTPQNRNCILATDAIAYEPYVSPLGSWIAVETQLLSDLQIIKVYRKDAKGCYVAPQYVLSEKIWNDFLRNRYIMLEDIEHPRIDFLKWIDDHKIQVHISGGTAFSTINEKFTYILDDKMAFDVDERVIFNRYIHDETLFFQFEISKYDKNIAEASFDDMDYDPSASSKKGNTYTLVFPDGITSHIELIKKHIEEIEYLSVNTKIYKNGVLKHTFSSDASEYYDRRYPNCISVHGDAGFYDNIIEILYDRTLHPEIMDLLKKNNWVPVIYDENGSEKRVDSVYIENELCTGKRCKVMIDVPKGEEFHAVSLLNGEGKGKLCATRKVAEAGPEIEPMEMPANERTSAETGSEIADKEMPPAYERRSDKTSSEAKNTLGSVDRALKKLKDANIVFDTPSSMDKHKTYIIHLKLNASEDIKELLKELDGLQKESATIKYSSRMKAELISENKRAFEITAISPSLQATSSLATTTWKWDVTPLESGEQYLHLSLTAFITIEGKETPFSVKTFDKRIKVNISLEDEVVTFIQSNWKWILGTLLFPFIGFLWSKLKGKKEDKDQKDNV